MSSHNPKAAGLIALMCGGNGTNRANEALRSGVSRTRTVHVGKDQYPVSVVQIAQVLDIAWKKKAVFYLLT